ncbi:MAG: FHA domain-containing protein [Verrucomicrobiales bacterium]|nr:FHA domain-containing protein [Verrucomicrobiales bacterium]
MEFNLQRSLDSGEIQEYKLKGNRVTIGRDPHNILSIPETYISSRHAIITRSETGECFIEDCDSSNGTYINERKVIGGKHRFKVGDVIRIAYVDLTVVAKPARHAIPVVPLRSRVRESGRVTSP